MINKLETDVEEYCIPEHVSEDVYMRRVWWDKKVKRHTLW